MATTRGAADDCWLMVGSKQTRGSINSKVNALALGTLPDCEYGSSVEDDSWVWVRRGFGFVVEDPCRLSEDAEGTRRRFGRLHVRSRFHTEQAH